jgi:hypothetical protein
MYLRRSDLFDVLRVFSIGVEDIGGVGCSFIDKSGWIGRRICRGNI